MRLLDSARAWARCIRRDGLALWFACKDARTPWYAKALAVFVVAYALSPIDLIPDFIPVLGYLDDVILLPALIWVVVRLLPAPVLAGARARAQEWLQTSGAAPRSIAGAIMIVAVWLALAAVLALWAIGALART